MNKNFIIFGVFLFLFSSCREAVKLKSSVRRTQTEFRYIKRLQNELKKGIGLVDKKSKDEAEGDSDADDSNAYLTMKQKNMLNNYGYLFDVINPKGDQIRSDNFTWDSVQKVYYVKNKNYKTIKQNNEVFGWHPYWMGSKWKNYPFELLSTIAYFSYKIDPVTGGYTNPAQIEEWKTTAMIDSAKVKNTRVLLTVSCHGFENNDAFLENKDRWGVLVETLTDLLLERDADGVDLNFEGISYFKREKFNRFVRYFRESFDNIYAKEGKTFYLSMTLPAVNNRDIIDVKELQLFTDLFVIMGYDYHIGPQAQGAVAPLRSLENSSLSLSTTLAYYLDKGLKPENTILALPYYGSLWKGELEQDGGAVYNRSAYDKPLTYAEIRKKYIDNEDVNVNAFTDDKSLTNYYSITFDDGSTQEIWFDDDYTLGKKYDFALSKKLKGIGIWALGYDNGYNDLWDVIEDKFSTNKKIVKNPIREAEGYPVRFSKYLLKNRTLFSAIAIFFLLTVVLAFLVLLFDWRVRDSIIKDQLILVSFVAVSFVLLIPITIVVYSFLNTYLPMADVFIKSEWKYYVSFFVGILTLFFAYKIKLKPIKRP
jgi:spore germination protein YaaH